MGHTDLTALCRYSTLWEVNFALVWTCNWTCQNYSANLFPMLSLLGLDVSVWSTIWCFRLWHLKLDLEPFFSRTCFNVSTNCRADVVIWRLSRPWPLSFCTAQRTYPAAEGGRRKETKKATELSFNNYCSRWINSFFKEIFCSNVAESQNAFDLEVSAVATADAGYHGYQVGRFLL